MRNTCLLDRQFFLYLTHSNCLFLFNFLHLNSKMLLDFSELYNFRLLNLLCFDDEIFLNFTFLDDLLLLDTSDLDVAIHLNFAFLDDLFLGDTGALNLLLHLVFALLDTLFHLKLEFERFRFSFSGIDSDVLLLVRFSPCLLLFCFEFLDTGIDFNLNDSDLFFLDDTFFFSFLLGCNFDNFTNTDSIKPVFSVQGFNRRLIYPDNRNSLKRQTVLDLQVLTARCLNFITKFLTFL